jgi:hypothetical protein
LTTEYAPPPIFSLWDLVNTGVEEDPNGAEDELVGVWRLRADTLPGRLETEGVRFNRGRSVGGRGAGPGFMN